jgi:hypothetical protein
MISFPRHHRLSGDLSAPWRLGGLNLKAPRVRVQYNFSFCFVLVDGSAEIIIYVKAIGVLDQQHLSRLLRSILQYPLTASLS